MLSLSCFHQHGIRITSHQSETAASNNECFVCGYAQLELLYGDALSKIDLDGSPSSHPDLNHSVSFDDDARASGVGSHHSLAEGGLESHSAFTSSVSHESQTSRGKSGRPSRLAPTDSHNPLFDELIKYRDPSHPRYDRLKEQRVGQNSHDIDMYRFDRFC